MRQEQETIKQNERDLFFRDKENDKIEPTPILISKDGEKIGNSNRKKIRIYDATLQNEIGQICIYKNNSDMISLTTLNKFEISYETYLNLLEILSNYYADSNHTKIIINVKPVSVEELKSYLKKHINDKTINHCQLYRNNRQVEDYDDFEGETHLYINNQDKRAYIKIPYDIMTGTIMKEQLEETAKHLQRYIRNDKYEIYAINNANEVYGKLTLDKLLGKEKITDKDLGIYEYYISGIIRCIVNKMNQQISIQMIKNSFNNKQIREFDTEMLLNFIENQVGKFNHYSFIDFNEFPIPKLRDFYFDNGKEEMLSKVKQVRKDIIKGRFIEEPMDTKLLDSQNAIVIEKEYEAADMSLPTSLALKYIYNAKTREKVFMGKTRKFKNKVGTYINFNEYLERYNASLMYKYGIDDLDKITFISKKNKEFKYDEAMKIAFEYCIKKGNIFCIGKKVHSYLSYLKKEDITYEDGVCFYDGRTDSFKQDTVELKRGIYIEKEMLEKVLKFLKVRIKVNENQDTAGIGQMGR